MKIITRRPKRNTVPVVEPMVVGLNISVSSVLNKLLETIPRVLDSQLPGFPWCFYCSGGYGRVY